MTTETKVCNDCGKTKPLSEFNKKSGGGKKYHQSQCKSCERERRSLAQAVHQRACVRLGLVGGWNKTKNGTGWKDHDKTTKKKWIEEERQIMIEEGLLNADGTWPEITAEVKICRIARCEEECVKHGKTGRYIHARCKEHVNETSTIGNDERKDIREWLGIDSKTWDAASREQKAQWRTDYRKSRGDVKPEPEPKGKLETDPIALEITGGDVTSQENTKEMVTRLNRAADRVIDARQITRKEKRPADLVEIASELEGVGDITHEDREGASNPDHKANRKPLWFYASIIGLFIKTGTTEKALAKYRLSRYMSGRDPLDPLRETFDFYLVYKFHKHGRIIEHIIQERLASHGVVYEHQPEWTEIEPVSLGIQLVYELVEELRKQPEFALYIELVHDGRDRLPWNKEAA